MRLILITAHPKNTSSLFGQAIQSLINNLLYLCRKDLIRFKVLQCNDSTGQLPSIDLGDFIRNVLPDLLVPQMVNAFMFDSGQYISRNIGIGRQAVFIFPVIHHGLNDKVFGNGFIVHIGTGKVNEALLIVNKELIKKNSDLLSLTVKYIKLKKVR